jgi:hypothetical protein
MAYLRQKLADWAPAVAAALLLLAWEQRRGIGAGEAAWIHEGACRELAAGTTEGRQALVGSVWFAPLAVLAGAPAAYLVPAGREPWAAAAASAAGVACALYAFRRLARRCLPAAAALPVWAAFAVMCRPMCRDPFLAVGVAAALAAAIKAVDWLASRRLADLVKFGFALAALALAGFPLAGFGLGLLLLLPVGPWLHAELRGRRPAVCILGGLPAVYAGCVWALMSWLILGDGLYPLRGLAANLRWSGAGLADVLPCLPAGLAILLVVAGGVWRRSLRAAAAGGLGLCLLAWTWLLQRMGLDWALGAAVALLPLLAMVALLHLAASISGGAGPSGQPRPVGAALAVVLALGLCAGQAAVERRTTVRAGSGASGQSDVLVRVASDVRERTPYGRIFVCGYPGLALLRGERPEPFVPCLDLHIGLLRRDYARQDLFLMIPVPTGAAASESLYWRYPDVYRRGTQSALFAGQYGAWRLFEIVAAPTEEMLKEWRKARGP